MTTKQQNLADRMDRLAENHPRGEELRKKAEELRRNTAGFFSEPQTVDVRQFVGSWARARRLWCEITGETLV